MADENRLKIFDMKGNFMSTVDQIEEEVKENAEHATQTVKDHVASAAESMQQEVKAKAEQEMQRGAGDVSAVADAVRLAADDLDTRERGAAARLARGAASSLDGVAQELDGKSVDQIADDIASFGRRNPLLLVGGAAVLGLAVGRFLTATTPNEDAYVDDETATAAPAATTGPRPVAPTTVGVAHGAS